MLSIVVFLTEAQKNKKNLRKSAESVKSAFYSFLSLGENFSLEFGFGAEVE